MIAQPIGLPSLIQPLRAVELDAVHSCLDTMHGRGLEPFDRLVHLLQRQSMRDAAAAGAGNFRRGDHHTGIGPPEMLAAAMIELADQQCAFLLHRLGQLAHSGDRGPVPHEHASRGVGLHRVDAQTLGDDHTRTAARYGAVEFDLTLPDHVALGQVRRRRRSHRPVPGNEIADAQRLEQRLGVSHTPIREALNTLAQEGLVTYQPNRGYVVTACTYDDIVGAYLVRRSLESLACRLAARNGLSLEQRVRMMQSIEEGQKLIDSGAWAENPDAWGALNAAFHAAIIDAAWNLPLARAINDTLRMPIMLSGGEEKQFTRYDMLAYRPKQLLQV